MTFIDGRLIDRVREEWPLHGADAGADLRAWREGAELYEDADDDELLPAGVLMAAAVRHHVHGGSVLPDDDLAVTVQSMLFAAGTPSSDDEVGVHPEACRLARLAVAVIAQQGWQPEHLGGNGHVTAGIFEDADVQRLLAAALPDVDGDAADGPHWWAWRPSTT